jgi:hypothetical protein
MVLFRHLSLRERWARRRLALGHRFLIAAGCLATLLFIDDLVGGPAQRALSLARQELAIAKCVERQARGAALGSAPMKLRKACVLQLQGP